MTHFIDPTSFIPNDSAHAETIRGSVEVTLRGKTKRVRALSIPANGAIYAYDLVGRYQTGTRAWPASLRRLVREDGQVIETAFFGRYDNHPKFRKENSIWFASVVGGV